MNDTERWVQRFEWHMDQLPVLMSTLRTLSVPLRAVRLDVPRVSGTHDPRTLPLRADVVDDADDLWAALAQYAANVADLLGVDPPRALRASWAHGGDVVGVASGVSGRDASFLTFEVIVWLLDRLGDIAGLPLGDSEEFLFSLIRSLRARYMVPNAERAARRRVCVVCQERGVGVSWLDVDGVAVRVGRCRRCGAVYGEADHDEVADVPGGGAAGGALTEHDPPLAPGRDADGDGQPGQACRVGGGAAGLVAAAAAV